MTTIDHELLGAVTGGYPSGFDPPGKQYRGDQWSDYLNPNAGKDQGFDANIDRGMSKQPDDPGMDQGIVGSPPPSFSPSMDI